MSSEISTPNNLAGLFRSQPALKQLVLLVGLAASIAVGIGGALWLRTPDFAVLYGNLSDGEASEIVDALQSAGIEYKVNSRTGAVMVKPSQVDNARISLASAGLPRGAGFGLEIIQEGSGITSSQFMENARYHHALETELSRTISSLGPVQSARVHLALPPSTVFLREKESPSASVAVHLFPGRTLEAGQIKSIVHLVASSIPELESSRVTVVDQNMHLLSDTGGPDDLVQSERQLDYARRIETDYEDRIRNLLAPLVGPDQIRATVAADIDFTMQEESSELYDPDGSVRSEQVQENRNSGAGALAGGIPGTLSNQAPQPATLAADGAEATDIAAPSNETVRQTRNYELNRTLSVTRRPTGTLERISVAVVVNETALVANLPEGVTLEEQLGRVEQLARQAVGFSEARGDSMTVTSATFYQAPPLPEIEAPSFLSSPAFRNTVMQVLSIVVLLVVGWGIARPIVRMLTASGGEIVAGGQGMLPAAAGAGGGASRQIAQLTYSDKVSAARELVGHDAERVADIVKGWVNRDG